MASSNSSVDSYATAETSPAHPIVLINGLAELLEALAGLEQQERSEEGGQAWTLVGSTPSFASFNRYDSSTSESSSFDTRSQVTVTPPASFFAASLKSRVSAVPDRAEAPKYGGLVKDEEGKETRSELLKRRRKQAACEEVDVALAPVMKIPVPYVFYPEQFKAFRKMFPRVNVDSGLSFTHHDHPVAHTATLVGMRFIQSMLKPGERVIDLNGNPGGNEAFNRFQNSRVIKRPNLPRPPVIATMVGMNTAMDAVRRVNKWGPQYGSDGQLRWFEGTIEELADDCCDTFFSCHTLYYYSMYDICKLMSRNKKAKMVALVNYSPEQSGTLYNELKFSKQGGMTLQSSPNGEKYSHPDIDQWFQTNSFRGLTETIDSGIAWTSHNIGGPLYAITITACEWGLARNKRYDPPPAPTLKVTDGRSLLGLVKIGGQEVRLRITNSGLASELRHWMTFRDRSDPQTFLDLCVKARRSTGRDLVEGTRQFEINDGELQDHVVYAYLVDAPGECELMNGIKMLKGDLLIPLAESLKFEGKVDKASWTSFLPLHDAIWGRKMKKGLGMSVTPVGGYIKPKQPGGLMPFARS